MVSKLGDNYGSIIHGNDLQTHVYTTPYAAQRPVSRMSLAAAFLFAVGLMILAVASNGNISGERIQSETNFNKIESSLDNIRTAKGERSFPKKLAPYDFSPRFTNNGKST